MSKKILFALLFGYFFRAFQKSFIWWATKDAIKKVAMEELTKVKKTDGTETDDKLKYAHGSVPRWQEGRYPWGSGSK